MSMQLPGQGPGRGDASVESQFEKRKSENMAKMLNIATALTAITDPEALLETVMQTAESIMNAEASSLMMLDRERHELRFVIATGCAKEEIRKRTVGLGKGIAGWVAQTGVYLVCNNPYEDPRFDPSYDRQTGFVTRSYLCMPLRTLEGDVLGTILVLNKRDGDFTEWDVQLFASFCNLATVALRNCRVEELLQPAAKEQPAAAQTQTRPSSTGYARILQQDMRPALQAPVGPLRVHACCQLHADVANIFYDALTLADGRSLVYLGELCPDEELSPVFAAKLAADMRSLLEGTYDVDAGIQRLNRLILNRRRDDLQVSWIALLFERGGKTVHAYRASQPPPVLVDATGARTLSVPDGGRLGSAAEVTLQPADFSIESGSRLLLASSAAAVASGAGLAQLRETAQRNRESADFVGDVFDTLLANLRTQDAALLGVTLAGAEASEFESRDLTMLSRPDEAGALKAAASDTAQKAGLPPQDMLIWTTAVVKAFLMTSAIAFPGRTDGKLQARLTWTPGRLNATLRAEGGEPLEADQFAPTSAVPAHEGTVRFLHANLDAVEVVTSQQGQKLRLTKTHEITQPKKA